MKELKEFEVIGYNIKLTDDYSKDNNGILAEEIVRLVSEEANNIKLKNAGLENGQVATLTALKIASDILRMEKDFKENIINLQGNANQALDYIKEFSSESSPS